MSKKTPIAIGNVGDLTYYWLVNSDMSYSMHQYPVLYQWEDHVVRWCDEYAYDDIMFCKNHRVIDICATSSSIRWFDKRQDIWKGRMQ